MLLLLVSAHRGSSCMQKTSIALVALTIACFFNKLQSRSIWQEQEDLPTIETFWKENTKTKHQLRHARLEYWAIFDRFNNKELQTYLLPSKIQCKQETISNQKITELCQTLIKELSEKRKKKRCFTNFTVLKDADFNYKEQHSNLIVKFKKYPLVLKLFCETPQSFVRPFSHGIVPSFLFSMGGGINRFLAGFTRIPNLETIKKIIAKNSKWKDKIILPRKWYWLPPQSKYFIIQGYNFGQQENNHFHQIEVPATYGIIADFIPCKKQFSINSKTDRTCAIELEAVFQNRIDPHICNFFFDESGKIALIDTEHFASIMGLDEIKKDTFTAYHELVLGLGNRYVTRTLFQNKTERINRTKRSTPHALCIR